MSLNIDVFFFNFRPKYRQVYTYNLENLRCILKFYSENQKITYNPLLTKYNLIKTAALLTVHTVIGF